MLFGMEVVDETFVKFVGGRGCFTGCLEDACFDVEVVEIGLIGRVVGGFFEEGVLDVIGFGGVVVDDFFEEGVLDVIGFGGVVVDDYFEEGVSETSGLGFR